MLTKIFNFPQSHINSKIIVRLDFDHKGAQAVRLKVKQHSPITDYSDTVKADSQPGQGVMLCNMQ